MLGLQSILTIVAALDEIVYQRRCLTFPNWNQESKLSFFGPGSNAVYRIIEEPNQGKGEE